MLSSMCTGRPDSVDIACAWDGSSAPTQRAAPMKRRNVSCLSREKAAAAVSTITSPVVGMDTPSEDPLMSELVNCLSVGSTAPPNTVVASGVDMADTEEPVTPTAMVPRHSATAMALRTTAATRV